jgi:hypothetical protein
LQRVRVGGLLVGAPARDARKPDRHAALVSRRLGDAFEVELEDVHRLDLAHGTEPRERVLPDPAVQPVQLFVGEPGVCLRHREQLASVPHREGHVGEHVGAPPAAGLRVDEHRVDAVRVDLPFPPVAARAAAAVRRVAALQHQPFDPAAARLGAQGREGFPALAGDLLGQHQPIAAAGDEPGEQRTPLRERRGAQIATVQLQQVVGDERGRRLGQDRGRELLAPDAPLQDREGQRRSTCVCEHLAVQDDPVRQRLRSRAQIGKPVRDQLLAPGP